MTREARKKIQTELHEIRRRLGPMTGIEARVGFTDLRELARHLQRVCVLVAETLDEA